MTVFKRRTILNLEISAKSVKSVFSAIIGKTFNGNFQCELAVG